MHFDGLPLLSHIDILHLNDLFQRLNQFESTILLAKVFFKK